MKYEIYYVSAGSWALFLSELLRDYKAFWGAALKGAVGGQAGGFSEFQRDGNKVVSCVSDQRSYDWSCVWN